jgi:hypothetical protein
VYQFLFGAKLVVEMLLESSPKSSDLSRPLREQTVGKPRHGDQEGVCSIFLILSKDNALLNKTPNFFHFHVRIHGMRIETMGWIFLSKGRHTGLQTIS